MLIRILGIALLIILGILVRRRLAALDAPPHAPALSSVRPPAPPPLPPAPTIVAAPATPAAPETVAAPATEVAEAEVAEVAEAAPESTPPADAPDDELAGIEGYCMRCKERRAFTDPREELTENGRRAARGTCPVCGANMFKFLPSRGEDS